MSCRSDSTQIKLQELERAAIFKSGTPLTDALLVLYSQWAQGLTQTPTLFDAVAVAYAMHPEPVPAAADARCASMTRAIRA